MSEKTVTEREAVERERRAFIDGCVWEARMTRERNPAPTYWPHSEDAVPVARARYPLPKVKRPRVVEDPIHSYEWKVEDGQLFFRLSDGGFDWRVAAVRNAMAETVCDPLAPRVAMWADLLANPTEEVDA